MKNIPVHTHFHQADRVTLECRGGFFKWGYAFLRKKVSLRDSRCILDNIGGIPMKAKLFSMRCFGVWFGLMSGVWLLISGVHAQNEPYQLPSRGEWAYPEVVDTETMPRGLYRQNLQLPKIFFPRNPRAPYDPNKTSEGEGTQDPSVSDFNPLAPNIERSWVGPNQDNHPGGTFYFPPDPEIGVGAGYVVVVVNSDIYIYNKDGDRLDSFTAEDLFNTSDSLFDPKVHYDSWRDRWLILFLRRNTNSQTSYWSLAISDDSNPRGNYFLYNFNARLRDGIDTSFWVDYPQMGFDNNAVYLTGTMFPWSSGSHHPKMLCLNKDQIYNGAGAYAYQFWNLTSQGSYDYYLVPAEQWSYGGIQYIVSAKTGSGTHLAVRRLTWPTGSTWNDRWWGGPVLSSPELIDVDNYTSAPDGVQPGGVQSLDNIDCRLLCATYRFGKLYTCHSVSYDWGQGNRAAIRIYRLNVGGATSAIELQSTYGASGFDYYYPAVYHLSEDDMVIVFGRSSSSTFPEVRVTGWRDTGSIEGSSLVKAGEATYLRLDSFNRNRWGDYFGAAIDTSDFRKVWVVGEYAKGSNKWGTWVAETQYPARLTPQNTVTNRTGQVGQTITLTTRLTLGSPPLVFPVPSVPVQFTVDGTEVGTATTDGNGYANLNYAIPESLGLGSKTITAASERTVSHNATSANGTLTVQQAATTLQMNDYSAKIGETIALRATLRRSHDNVPIAGRMLTFLVNGSSVGSGVTDAQGSVLLAYTVPENLGVGMRGLEARYNGEAVYGSSTISRNLTVNPANTSLSISPVSGQCDQTVNLQATLTNQFGGSVAGRTITFLFRGNPVGTAVTNAQGVATLPMTIPPSLQAGNQPLEVIFAGDALYLNSQRSGSLNLLNTPPVATPAGAMLQFDGVDDKVEIAHDAALNSLPLTLEAWVRTNASSGQRGLLNKYSSGSLNGYQLFLLNGQLRAWYFGTTGNVWDGSEGLNGGNIADGNWHHIAFVVDNSGGRLYVDGVLRATRGWNGTPSAPSTVMPFSFGYYNSPAGGYFAGEMDEIRLWSRARSRREIIRDMQAILNGNETGLTGYWKLDRGHGTTAVDSNAPAQNGTLLGNMRWRVSTAPIDLVNVAFGTSRSFMLSAFDINDNTLTYAVLTNPTKGSLSGTPPNLSFNPVRGGLDGFTYRVSDSQSQSAASNVRLNILVPGDVNGDGCVDDADLLAVLFAFGQTCSDCSEDLSEDGTIDDADLLMILFNFGTGC
jgi:hypothetical protein